MSIIKKIEAITNTITLQANAVSSSESTDHTSRLLTSSINALVELRILEHDYRFKSKQEEISYYKEYKPVIYAFYFFYVKRMEWDAASLFKSKQDQGLYYNDQRYQLEQEYLADETLYNYFLSGASHLDELYFLNGGMQASYHGLPGNLYGYDMRKGKWLSLLQLTEFLNRLCDDESKKSTPHSLRWTASRTELNELLYALFVTGVFDNGQCSFKKITELFGALFQVDVKNFAQGITKIKMRKEASQTFFLDLLKDNLQKHFDKNLN
jgi:hypothetical protein